MKIKILIMPFIIVIIITISIWLVYPAYSNGVNGVRENYIKLKSEQAKLAELQGKSENVNNLSAQISSLSEKDVLYSFVPTEIKEEEIINDLVNLSANSGLFLFSSMINQPTKEISDGEISVVETSKPANGDAILSMPKVKNIKTEIKLAGSYEKIKDFLISIEKLNRSNDFEILEISKNNIDSNLSADPGILSVNATTDFNFMKLAKLDNSNVSSPVFSSSKLQTKIIEDIKNKKNTNNYQLSVEQRGKSNLFQP